MEDGIGGQAGAICDQCGARYRNAGDSCEERFAALLALDHSRQEPWGSRHLLAFSAFTLQHPRARTRDQLERCWTALYRVFEKGDDAARLARGFRSNPHASADEFNAPPLPSSAPTSFDVTIADLGEFAAESYAAEFERWCRATLAGWEKET